MSTFTAYRERGWSVFPLRYQDKRPVFAWAEFQARMATLGEASNWDQGQYNIALACGELSGVVVVDVDGQAGYKALRKHGRIPPGPVVYTAKGEHLYFKWPGFRIANKARFVEDVDFRGDGGYVVLPPSMHENGHRYEWAFSPDESPLPDIPEWLMLLINPPRQEAHQGERTASGEPDYWLGKALERATAGTRDDTAFWLACQLRDDGQGLAEVERVLTDYARQVTGMHDHGYTEREALATARSAFRQGAREPARHEQPPPSAADTAIYAEEAWAEKEKEQPGPSRVFVTTDEVYAGLIDELLGEIDAAPEYPPYPFPCRAMHHLGGFAEDAWPAKMVYICGGSGFLKTTFAEFLQDNLLRGGYDFAHYGPEWTPDEMGIRATQRYGGASLREIAKHRVYMADVRHKAAVPRSVPLTQDRISETLGIIDQRMQWPGRGYYLNRAVHSLRGLVEDTIAAVTESRKAGRQFVAVFWDYLEVMRRFSSKTAETFWGERIASVFKAVSIEYGFTGYLLVQAKKGEADDVLKVGLDGGDLRENLLGPASGQGITNQAANLMITLNPMFDREGRLTGSVLLNVCKNSGGVPGVVPIKVNPRLLQFMDRADGAGARTD